MPARGTAPGWSCPRRDPSAAPPSSTTIGCSVNGTGVNGSGILTCAATAVRTVTNSTAAVRIAARQIRASRHLKQRARSTGDRSRRHGLGILLYAYSTDNRGQRLGRRRRHPGGPENLCGASACTARRAITAVTAQNTLGVIDMGGGTADLVTAQIEAVEGDMRRGRGEDRHARHAAIVEAVSAAIEELDLPNVVVDPVMVAKGGDRLLDAEASARSRPSC